MIEFTENLLFTLEDKIVSLLSNSEDLRQQIQRLQQENVTLRQEREASTRKLQDLVSLLDSVNPTQAQPVVNTAYAAAQVKPVLVEAN